MRLCKSKKNCAVSQRQFGGDLGSIHCKYDMGLKPLVDKQSQTPGVWFEKQMYHGLSSSFIHVLPIFIVKSDNLIYVWLRKKGLGPLILSKGSGFYDRYIFRSMV